MNERGIPEAGMAHPQERAHAAGTLRNGENLLMTLVLAAMVLLPLLDIVLRWTPFVLPASSSVQSHLTLLVCMIGGAIAAREGRLLALSTVTTFLKGHVKAGAVSSAVLSGPRSRPCLPWQAHGLCSRREPARISWPTAYRSGFLRQSFPWVSRWWWCV